MPESQLAALTGNPRENAVLTLATHFGADCLTHINLSNRTTGGQRASLWLLLGEAGVGSIMLEDRVSTLTTCVA